MTTDTRTGGMAGGAGQPAMATAMSLQVLRQWNLPRSAIAGATDSKLPDAQAGFEQALRVNTAMQARLMGVNSSAQAIDNDMQDSLLRANIPPDISVEAFAIDAISDMVRVEGHFLGRPETLARMTSDFLYPDLADRSTIKDWEAGGSGTITDRAKDRARRLLETHFPGHPEPGLRSELRAQNRLRLEERDMEAT